MRRRWLVLLAPGALVVMGAVFVAALLLIKLLWAWTVPELLPGAVDQGLVARDISWLAALKVAVLVAVLSAVSGAGRSPRR